jgi:two-component system OmpR family response regulator
MTGIDRVVLVIEDDPDLADAVRLVLEDAGYRVRGAVDGQQAIDDIRQEMPGLILLDMKMPRMSGWEFVREFRAAYDHAVPIILFTAARDPRQHAVEIAADGYLAKPFEMDDLLAIVSRYLP